MTALEKLVTPEIAEATSSALGYALDEPCTTTGLQFLYSAASYFCMAISNRFLMTPSAQFGSQKGKDEFIALFEKIGNKYSYNSALNSMKNAVISAK